MKIIIDIITYNNSSNVLFNDLTNISIKNTTKN